MSPLERLFQGRIRRRLGKLKQSLLGSEIEEERGGERGWRPQQQVSDHDDSPAQTRGGRVRETGSPVFDEPYIPTELPCLYAETAALDAYEAGHVWDIGDAIRLPTEKQANKGLLLLFTLGHCQWSDDLVAAIERHRAVWAEEYEVMVLRGGDRLNKVYFRDVQLGDTSLNLGTFPALFRFKRSEQGLQYQNLCLDPLSGGSSLPKLTAFLAGESVVPAGSDEFFVSVCRGSFCLRLSSQNKWSQSFEVIF